MPLLKIRTNTGVDEGRRSALLQAASETTARALGKPEAYVMVILEPQAAMQFAGDEGPAAYLELKSINLPETDTAKLSATLCKLMGDGLGIPPDRVYIEFSNAERHLWGYNNSTF